MTQKQTGNGNKEREFGILKLGALPDQPDVGKVGEALKALQADVGTIKGALSEIPQTETQVVEQTVPLKTVAYVTGGLILGVTGSAAGYFGMRRLITGV
jgi:hypothetical protein